MLDKDRLALISSMVYERQGVKTSTVAKELGITNPTARKYLDHLASSDSRIERVHGGASLSPARYPSGETELYKSRASVHRTEKVEIAHKALGHVSDRDTIMVDSSTTCFEFARLLLDTKLRLTVITSGIRTAQLLSENDNITVIIVGGVLYRQSNTIIDEFDCKIYERFNIDTFFFSASCVSIDCGFSEYNLREIDKKRECIGRASNSIALIDSSKLEKKTSSTFAELPDVSLLITDGKIDPKIKAAYEKRVTVE